MTIHKSGRFISIAWPISIKGCIVISKSIDILILKSSTEIKSFGGLTKNTRRLHQTNFSTFQIPQLKNSKITKRLHFSNKNLEKKTNFEC